MFYLDFFQLSRGMHRVVSLHFCLLSDFSPTDTEETTGFIDLDPFSLTIPLDSYRLT